MLHKQITFTTPNSSHALQVIVDGNKGVTVTKQNAAAFMKALQIVGYADVTMSDRAGDPWKSPSGDWYEMMYFLFKDGTVVALSSDSDSITALADTLKFMSGETETYKVRTVHPPKDIQE